MIQYVILMIDLAFYLDLENLRTFVLILGFVRSYLTKRAFNLGNLNF